MTDLFQDVYPTHVTIGNLSDHLDKLVIGKKCLIVTTQHSYNKLGISTLVEQYFSTHNISFVIYNKITPNPQYIHVLECYQLHHDFNPDFILAVGGGSAVDAAKAISLMMNGIDPLTTTGEGKPLSVILTLSGSGTEVTPYSILTQPNGTKKSIAGKLFPTESIIDTSFQSSIPSPYKYALLCDIMSHCIESYLSIKMTQRSSEASLKGMQLSYLPNSNINDIDLSIPSILGGSAITITGTSIPHGLGYYMTTKHSVAHGIACAIFTAAYLEVCMKQPELKKRWDKLCDYLKVSSDDLLSYISKMVQLSLSNSKITIEKTEIDVIVEEFFATGKDKQHVGELSKADVEGIIIKSLIVKE
ncbi:alcohol dehydrogenase [Entamoeba marina]